MRKLWKYCFMTVFFAVILLSLSLSASAETYEPDGSTSVKYDFAAAECNRTLIVRCVDENGTHLKTVQIQTKRGEEVLTGIWLYGYDIVGFESNQGLWETCKLSWSSSCYVDYSLIFIRYYFRTGMSADSLTATVTMRKSGNIKVITRHYLRTDYSIKQNTKQYWAEHSDTCTISYRDPFTSAAKDFAGHYLLTGMFTQIEGTPLPNGYPALISGNFSYTLIKNAYGINDVTAWMEWKVQNGSLKKENEEYTTFKEDKDGKFGYCTDRVLYLDLYYEREQYDVYFSANGGSGEIAHITQYYGFDITIPDTAPVREGYIFRGWCADQTATTASYTAGNTYRVTGGITLYAVWEKDDYEFSISNLTVSEKEIFQNSIISVRVRVDSWDENDVYKDVPVELYYDGNLLATQWLDFDIYCGAYVTFRMDVGTVTGKHEIEVQINRTGVENEKDQTNNRVGNTITVKSDKYAFGITSIANNAPYTEGMTVITSYLISNDSERHVYPDAEALVVFDAYYFDENGTRIMLDKQYWHNLAIPIGKQNLVYFKWDIPNDMAGVRIYCECNVNADGALTENNRNNNTARLTTIVADRASSQTANPTFTSKAPSGYTPQNAPSESVGSASWTIWAYENSSFVLKKYGIKIDAEMPKITPDSNCASATYNGDVWTVRSGYGITMNFTPQIVVLRGYKAPDQDSYTDLQSAYATFSEYGYRTEDGEYRELVYYNDAWCFVENEDSVTGDRIHYIPIWLPDGEYVVSVVLSELWTPVGRITAVRSSNVILIDGSLYDDWYN